ncbi:rhomboid family intramembrane serine protease [Rhizobium sp.]|jgi:membrane associated rhomboid family serine protease|uniref:rhomboid family intramembrane serine protease n=1 Tax=Rhizobium sp. TaxID=391 RepID=UPI000E8BFCDB|nr:rhomboid family intramembrane serine protease [Rhizobium sp.]
MDDKSKEPWDQDSDDGVDDFDDGVSDSPQTREPVFNLPGGVLLALVMLFLIYALTNWIVSDTLSYWIERELGFSPIRYVTSLREQDQAWIWTPFTYSLLHGSVEHLAFNGLWLAAFGTPVWRRIGAWRFVVFWLVTAAAAAFAHAALNWGAEDLLIGASGVISALMGAACRFAFGPGRAGFGFDDHDAFVPRLSVIEALRQRMVLTFILMFFAGNLIIAFGIPLVGDPGGAIAWDAHIGGFIVGFFGFALFDRRLNNK